MVRLIVYAVVPFGLMLIPASFVESAHTVCLFNNIFHVDCPGCGITRAVLSVLHGDFAKAFYYNRLVVLVFPLLCYQYFVTLRAEYKRLLTTRRREDKTGSKWDVPLSKIL